MRKHLVVAAVLLAALALCVTAYAGAKRDIKDMFMATCYGCHDSGMMDAPIAFSSDFTDREKAKGFDKLVENAMKGLDDMPAKGSCGDCTRDEIKALTRYMLGSGD